jgi:hypothetical protein
MRIDVRWGKPIRLRNGSRVNLIYTCPLERIPDGPGVYVFARSFARSIVPLYVGQAQRLRKRIEQQFNNVRLMIGLQQSQHGHRIMLVGHVTLRRGQQKTKVLNLVESALIKRALADGHELLNVQGTKTKVNVIKSKGNTSSRQIAPLTMYAER